MVTHISTTPFGRRPMTLAQMASQAGAKAIDRTTAVPKWQAFRDITEARDAIGATDRSLAILNALLSFHREDDLSGEGGLVVFPSNEQLIRRANGMSPATLRRHLSVLVTCGLVIRRDSPNGKRFARKGEGGQIEQAYGFDLGPIVARAEEFKQLAAAVQAERKAYRLVKERLTICRRDIVKMIDAGVNEQVPCDWRRFQTRYEAAVARLPRTASRQLLESVADELEDIWAEVHQLLETFVKSQNMNANESHFERHIQNSNPDSHSTDETEDRYESEQEASGSAGYDNNVHSLPKRELPLGMVLDACPEILNMGRGAQIRTWRDFVAAAELARPHMGVSPSAWQEAVQVMGPENAAITIAAMLQRTDQINSRGGYLRNLTERARNGQFSVWPMVMALLRARLDAKTSQNAGKPLWKDSAHQDGLASAPRSAEISEALRLSMKRKGWD
ncbi:MULTISPECIES: plasmid replication protein RepC [unclassified Mesorhizobium]|uniref:plasmid replication protein RepC n=1 Tax=unclassified Mesorhizobium TaxID=325217 RepID=UPI001126B8C7|nr:MULTISPECIES: plasmid replication protein RepC [unclassified Mesorhizobium]MBZ9973957.1 replication initiation protein RepC [Mesorhizobium sp. BR-1-1-10]TPK10511.1 replication initiation protein RepC [Mesorhizobium sp. B2-5-7]